MEVGCPSPSVSLMSPVSPMSLGSLGMSTSPPSGAGVVPVSPPSGVGSSLHEARLLNDPITRSDAPIHVGDVSYYSLFGLAPKRPV